MRLAICAVLLAVLACPAQGVAAAPDGAAGPWVDEIVSVAQSLNGGGGAVDARRSDVAQMLGVAEGTDDQATAFSLGIQGQVTARFTNAVCNGPGADLQFVETTQEPYGDELAAIYASADGASYTRVAASLNKDGTVDLPAALPAISHVRLIDVTPSTASNADGYDVDGIRAIHTAGCAPTPAATALVPPTGPNAETQIDDAPHGTRAATFVNAVRSPGRATLHSTQLRSKKGVVGFRVDNPGRTGVFITATLRPLRAKGSRVTPAAIGRRVNPVSIPALSSRVIRMRLTPAGRALLAGRRVTKLALTLVVIDPSGRRKTIERRVDVRPATAAAGARTRG